MKTMYGCLIPRMDWNKLTMFASKYWVATTKHILCCTTFRVTGYPMVGSFVQRRELSQKNLASLVIHQMMIWMWEVIPVILQQKQTKAHLSMHVDILDSSSSSADVSHKRTFLVQLQIVFLTVSLASQVNTGLRMKAILNTAMLNTAAALMGRRQTTLMFIGIHMIMQKEMF